ncbi:MAG: hypothetical protein HQL40_03320 [Alphaproteobacteria bacterium]|nr:hypothetical protein [Alphaproteobacteria bacterium]
MSIHQLIGLVPLFPWLAAAWIGIGRIAGRNVGEAGERQTAVVAQAAALSSLLFMLILDGLALAQGAPGQVALFPWLESGAYRVMVSFTLDPLGLSMGTLVAFVALLVTRFSVNYMHREAGFQRFFAVLSLFSGAMLLIVTAGNAVLAFVGWELAGLGSFLLIGYNWDRPTATGNANRAFVTNRFGDAGFVTGIALSFLWLGGIEWPDILGGAHRLETLGAGLVAGGFLLAALAKSAQLPFAAWLSRALEGPTPSSAVFYGSLMVHAGVYLLIRLEPLLAQAPALMVMLALIGLATALYGVLVGLVQTDVKSALIFSVQAQVGLMVLECGLGWFELAAWHMAAHAAWRVWQFLNAPSYMHMAEGPARPVPAWLAGRRFLYTAALQRFWLDAASDALLTRPTEKLGADVRRFDERVVDRAVGLPDSVGAVRSLAEWEERRSGARPERDHGVSRGRGMPGRALQWTATALQWFEERLVLQSGGEGLLRVLRHIGGHVVTLDRLASQPRYLVLLIVLTFVVIL